VIHIWFVIGAQNTSDMLPTGKLDAILLLKLNEEARLLDLLLLH